MPPSVFTVICYVCGEQQPSNVIVTHQNACLKIWNSRNNEIPKAQRLPPPARPKLKIPAQPGEQLDEYNMEASSIAANNGKLEFFRKSKGNLIGARKIINPLRLSSKPPPTASGKKSDNTQQSQPRPESKRTFARSKLESFQQRLLSKRVSDSALASRPSLAPSVNAPSKEMNYQTITLPNLIQEQKVSSLYVSSTQKAMDAYECLDSDFSVDMSIEEAINQLETLNLDGWFLIRDALVDNNTIKTRISALKAFTKQILTCNKIDGQLATYSPPITVFLRFTTKSFKISEIVMMELVFSFLVQLIAKSQPESPFDRRAAAFCIFAAIQRLSDHRLQGSIDDLLKAFANVLGPSFVFETTFKVLEITKRPIPTIPIETLEILKNIIEEYGPPNAVEQSKVAEILTTLVNTEIPKIRIVAVDVLGLLFHFWGFPFQKVIFSQMLKPSSKSIIEAKFDKIPVNGMVDDHIQKISYTQNEMKLEEDIESPKKVQDLNFDNLNLHVVHTLQELLNDKIEERLNDEDWRIRKDAIQQISNACKKSGGFGIASDNASRRLIQLLQDRAENDKELNLRPNAIVAIGELILRLNEPTIVCEALSNGLASILLDAFLCDKNNLRNPARRVLEKCSVRNSAMDYLIRPISERINSKSKYRLQLLEWMTSHLHDVTKEFDCLIEPLIQSIQDPSPMINKLASDSLSFLIARGLVNRAKILLHIRHHPNKTVIEALAPLINLILIESASENVRKQHNTKRTSVSQYASASTAFTTTTRHSSYSMHAADNGEYTTEDDEDDFDPDKLKNILAQVHQAYGKIAAEHRELKI